MDDDSEQPVFPPAAGTREPQGHAAPRRGRPIGSTGGRRSCDLLETFVFQSEVLGRSAENIARDHQTFSNLICAKTVRNAIKRYRETGLVDYPPRAFRARKMSPSDSRTLCEIVEQDPWLYLSEIAEELSTRTGKQFTRAYVHYALIGNGISLKVMQQVVAERDELKRAVYWDDIRDHVEDWQQLIFADETALDGRVLRR
jgi:transposase